MKHSAGGEFKDLNLSSLRPAAYYKSCTLLKM